MYLMRREGTFGVRAVCDAGVEKGRDHEKHRRYPEVGPDLLSVSPAANWE